MSPRPDVSEERTDQILDAASEVFVEKGFQKARMDDIAEKSGLSKGAIYWYFKSKDDIVFGIFDRLFTREAQELEVLISSKETASSRLITYTERVIKDVNRLLRFAPIAFEFLSLAFRHKFFQNAFKRYLSNHMEILIPIIQQGIESGEFHDLDPSEAAIAVGALFEGTLALWVYNNHLVEPEHHIRVGIQLLIDGFKAYNHERKSNLNSKNS
jgi:AcrR family transcriptional regulator